MKDKYKKYFDKYKEFDKYKNVNTYKASNKYKESGKYKDFSKENNKYQETAHTKKEHYEGYDLDYDHHGNILFTDVTQRENYISDTWNVKNSETDKDEIVKLLQAPGKQGGKGKVPGSGGVGLQNLQNIQTPQVRRPPVRGQGGRDRRKQKGGSRSRRKGAGSRRRTKETGDWALGKSRKDLEQSRSRAQGAGGAGGRRFDKVAPTSGERRDVKVRRGQKEDFFYYDYLYYD